MKFINKFKDDKTLRQSQPIITMEPVPSPQETPKDIESQCKGIDFWRISSLNNYRFLHQICRHSSNDKPAYWDNFRTMLQRYGILYDFVADELLYNIESTTSEPELFRVNSGATFLMSSILRSFMHSELREKFVEVIQFINTLPLLEIDTSKVNKETAQRNVLLLIPNITVVIERLYKLIAAIPKEMQYLFTVVRSSVERRFPRIGVITVGGFVFLRMINPVLLSPSKFGLENMEFKEGGKRSMLLITKTLQALSNRSENPFKEDYMLPLSSFVISRYSDTTEVLLSVSNHPEQPIVPEPMFQSFEDFDESISFVLAHFNTMAPAQMDNFVKEVVKGGDAEILSHFFMMLNHGSTFCTKYKLEKPALNGIFVDEYQQDDFEFLESMYDQSIKKYQDKIEMLFEEMINLTQLVSDFKKVENNQGKYSQ